MGTGYQWTMGPPKKTNMLNMLNGRTTLHQTLRNSLCQVNTHPLFVQRRMLSEPREARKQIRRGVFAFLRGIDRRARGWRVRWGWGLLGESTFPEAAAWDAIAGNVDVVLVWCFEGAPWGRCHARTIEVLQELSNFDVVGGGCSTNRKVGFLQGRFK